MFSGSFFFFDNGPVKYLEERRGFIFISKTECTFFLVCSFDIFTYGANICSVDSFCPSISLVFFHIQAFKNQSHYICTSKMCTDPRIPSYFLTKRTKVWEYISILDIFLLIYLDYLDCPCRISQLNCHCRGSIFQSCKCTLKSKFTQ